MSEYVCCDVKELNTFRMYVKRKDGKPTEYRFGSSVQASILSIAGGYKSPQEAVRAWLESLPEQRREAISSLNEPMMKLNHKFAEVNDSLHELNDQFDKTIKALRGYNETLDKIANME